MNRSFAAFLWFLLALCVTFGVGVWWLGPAVVSLAVDGDRRSTPYYVVHLASVPDGTDSSGYFQQLRQLVREEEGQLLWRGALTTMHSGRLADERDDLLVYRFAAGADVVQLLTSAEYRDLAAAVPPLLLGTPTQPEVLEEKGALLLWLLRLREEKQADSLSEAVAAGVAGAAPAALASVFATLGPFHGQMVWQAPVDVVAGQVDWNTLVVLAFPDSNAASAWLADSRTATELALARKAVSAQALLEFNARL